MKDTITIEGKEYVPNETTIHDDDGTMAVNTTVKWSTIFQYEIPKTEIKQFRKAHDRNNEIYIKLQDAVPAEIEDAAKIRIYKANSKGLFRKMIWEGTYGQLADSTERTDIANIVTPNQKVRLDEGHILMIDLYAIAVIVVANCTIELRVQEFYRA